MLLFSLKRAGSSYLPLVHGYTPEETLALDHNIFGKEDVHKALRLNGPAVLTEAHAGPVAQDDSDKYGFGLGQSLRFQYTHINSGHKEAFMFKVCNDLFSGYWYLEDQNGARLYFIKTPDVFYMLSFWGNDLSPLRYLFAALPCLPLRSNKKGDIDQEVDLSLPLHISYHGIAKGIATFASIFTDFFKNQTATYNIAANGRIVLGRVRFNNQISTTTATVDPMAGILELSIGPHRMERDPRDLEAFERSPGAISAI